MKRLPAIIIVLGLCGCRQSAPPAPAKPFVVTDIKGDILGMGLDEYQKKHPKTCTPETPPSCNEFTTYAGFNANKYAHFVGGRLFKVEFDFRQSTLTSDAEKLVASLREKFGEPEKEVGPLKSWNNSTVTMEYYQFDEDGASLTFIFNPLKEAADAQGREEEKQRAAARKKDM